jgi:lantibiotic modifying enzyme
MDPASQRPWQPILSGADAERAQRIVDGMVAALAPLESDLRTDLDGAAGRALFFAYLSEHRAGSGNDAEPRALVDRHLDQAIDALAATTGFPSLWGGFLGVAWVAQHVRGRFAAPDEPDDSDDNESIDELLGELLARTPWTGEYDLVSGLCGHGIYGLERLNRAVGRRLVELAVERLGELSEPQSDGLTWHTPVTRVAPWARPGLPNGYYNTGVAHGVPGVVTMLAGACAAGLAVTRARPLLDGAVHWLLQQRGDGAVAFPSWIADGKPSPARLAWCYGDPGVAAALLAAGNAVAEPRWVAAALELGRRAATLGRDAAAATAIGVNDAGLCHGAAGLALIFHRLWQHAGEPLFADAARWWYGRVLDFHRPGLGIGGYQAWDTPNGGSTFSWVDDDSFLVGSVGVGLTLLAGIGRVEPAWDRLLATSLAPV